MRTVKLLLVMFLSTSVYAQDEGQQSPIPGAGSSGGGQGISSEGRLALRELVEGVKCKWTLGATFIEEIKRFDEITFFIQTVLKDREFAVLLGAEVLRLNVCMSSSPLRELPESVGEAVTIFDGFDLNKNSSEPEEVQEKKQIAIRIGTDIYIDEKLFTSLDEDNKKYFMFHELLHGFIPMGIPGRMTKLRDFVATFKEMVSEVGGTIDDVGRRFVIVTKEEDLKLQEKLIEKFERARSFNGVGNKLSITEVEGTILVSRYLLDGPFAPIEELFSWGLSPNTIGTSGTTLFHELVWKLRTCRHDDPRLSCKKFRDLLFMYLRHGADGNTLFDNKEGWDPLPVWDYLLRSAYVRGFDVRTEMADIILSSLMKDPKKAVEMKEKLNAALHDYSQNPLQSDAVAAVLKHGAEVDSLNAEGVTALFLAASIKSGEGVPFQMWRSYLAPVHIVLELVKGGADVHFKHENKTPYDIFEAQKTKVEEFSPLKGREQKEFEIVLRLLKDGKEAVEWAESEWKQLPEEK